MKHSVTYVASVLSAASVTGAQMAVAIFSTAPPSSLLVGDVVCDDVLLTARAICQHMTACFHIPLLSHKRGPTHMGVGLWNSDGHVKDGYLHGVHEKVRAGHLLWQQHH